VGQLTQTDGFRYTGAFKSGEIDGDGTAIYPNGDTYVGAFAKGRRQGRGVLTYATGQISSGVWENGILRTPDPEPAAEGE
jgi:hypothetical protein